MPFTLVVTTAGRAKVVNPANTGTLAATITQVGVSATAVVPAEGVTTLTGEIKRLGSVGGEVVADDTIHVSMLDQSADAYICRSVALYLGDGTLFAVASGGGDALFDKAAGSNAAAAFDIVLADIAAGLISFGDTSFMEVTATTERVSLVELATVAEAQAGIDALRVLTPASAKAAILGWLLSQDGSGSGLDADLLDGQDGSYYANIAARLGFTPVNKAGDTMGGALLGVAPTAAAHLTRKDYVDALVTAAALLAKLVTVDGSGSGLDADLLDGQDSSYFTNIIARLGYTPLNSASYTAADVIAKLLGVDGSGSGLDADLLDGQDSSYYANIVARLGYTPVNRAGDTMLGALQGIAPTAAAHLTRKDYVDALVTAAALMGKLLTVDGSGSGLDADLLDGLDSSAFALASAALGGSWQDMSGARFLGASYQNTSGKPIMASVEFDNGGGMSLAQVSTDNVNWVTITSGRFFGHAQFIVPNGHFYRVTNGGGAAVYFWAELR